MHALVAATIRSLVARSLSYTRDGDSNPGYMRLCRLQTSLTWVSCMKGFGEMRSDLYTVNDCFRIEG